MFEHDLHRAGVAIERCSVEGGPLGGHVVDQERGSIGQEVFNYLPVRREGVCGEYIHLYVYMCVRDRWVGGWCVCVSGGGGGSCVHTCVKDRWVGG